VDKKRVKEYTKPTLERFGTLRDLTQVGCTLGGDGVWICRVPPLNEESSVSRS
jgi:hypothetical protein